MNFITPARFCRVLLKLCCTALLSWFCISANVLAQSSQLAECARALYRGEYARAAKLAHKRLLQFPNDVPVRVMLARADLAQGNFQEAFAALQKALASDPKNVDALYYMSLIAKEMSQREYQRLLSMAPDSARAHQLLGEAALANQNRTEAETEFSNALKANPRSTEVLVELAELKRSQSKFDEAISYYSQAQRIEPLNYEAAYGLGACYTYKQEYPQAIEWLRKAVALDLNSAAAHFALGNALFQNGQFGTAIPELNTSLRLEPRLKQAYFLLGRAYAKTGNQQQAKAALQKLDELNRAEMPGQEKEPGANSIPKSNGPQTR